MHGDMQSISDLNMGLHLSSMLSNLTANVQQILESGMTRRKPGETHHFALWYLPTAIFGFISTSDGYV